MAIRLNKQTLDKEKIIQLLKQSVLNPTYELECIVGGDFNNKNGTVSFQQFNKIISRVNGKREFVTKRPEDKLTISFPRDSRYRNIRITVNGFNAINYYCINDKLDGIMGNVTFETKELVKDNLDRVIIPAYNLKFNQKAETAMEKDQSIIKDLLRDWKDLPKVFRYKKSYHFISVDGMFSLDCSIVRTSSVATREITVEEVIEGDLLSKVQQPADEKMSFIDWWKRISKNPKSHVMVQNTGLYFKSVKESRVFENPLTYEVEVEFVGNKILAPGDNTAYMLRQKYLSEKDKDAMLVGLFGGIFKYIGIILQCVQDSFYIISNDDMLKIIGDYSRLTGKNRKDTSLFFGPLPVDLDKNKLIQLPDNAYENMSRVYDAGNILIDYCVTDKSDGVRNLLFIDSNGDCYLIGRDSISLIKNVGVRIPMWTDSLFDGEYLEYDTNGEYLNKFVIFDAYFTKGKNIMTSEFGDGKTNLDQSRYGAILAFTGQTTTGQGVQLISEKMPFRIDKKTFLFGELSTTPVDRRNYNLIFQQSARLLNKMNKQYGGTLTEGNLYSYKTDGLIYTPVRLGVYQSNPANTNIPDYRMVTSRKWDKCYKWKPSQFLTIDFRVVLLKDIKTNERQYIYYGNQKYVRAELRCMNYASRVNSYGEENARDSNIKYDSGLNAYLLNEGMNLETLPLEMPFMATYPFLGVRDVENNLVMTTNQCLIPVSETGELITEEGEQLYDGDTVEFRYISPDAPEPHEEDKNIVVEDDAMRWRALRVRRGKQPNALRVCLDIWALMHSPVTSKHVTNGLSDEDLSSGDLNYYLGTENNVFITDPLKKFNNFVKGAILDKYLKTQTNPKLLDLGCGKLGDVWKYGIYGVKTLVGIDLSHDNLNNKVDGAATRIFQNMNSSPRLKALGERTLLINGSFTDSLATGEAGIDALAKYYLDILYGRFKPMSNQRLMRFYNLGVDGYNCVTSMYVIHYAFNTEADLDQYLENVSSSLKDQGYFIGTCFDGNSILDKLNGSSTPGMVEGLVDDTTVWRIDRKAFGADTHNGAVYDANMALQVKVGLTDMYSTESPYVLGTGNKINVYFETINNISKENLVDIKFLEYKAAQHGLKLLESRCFTEEPGSMLTEYLSSGKADTIARVEEIKKEKALMQWAEWNRYFVFQKTQKA
jgi:hypothetical protein